MPGAPRKQDRFGWAGPELAVAEYPKFKSAFHSFFIAGQEVSTENQRVVAWDAFQELNLKYDFAGQTQEIGDCVSWGIANAIMATAAWEIARLGEPERWHPMFPPWFYAISRLTPEGGNGRLGRQDGSLGSWAAAATLKYGCLRSDYQGVPEYSGRVAKAWGTERDGQWNEFKPEADQRDIKSAARVRSADQLRDAICNGYFASIASNRGWAMGLRDQDGKSWFHGRDRWPHQMAYWGYDPDPVPCFYMKNQWGSAHGRQLDGPDGGGWREFDEVDHDLRQPHTECYVVSQFDGYPAEHRKPDHDFMGPK